MKISPQNYMALILLFAWSSPGVLFAADNTSQGTPAVDAKPADNVSTPETKSVLVNPYYITVGSFLFRPQLGITTAYDSNIFAQRTNEVADKILILEPNLLLKSNWKKHSLQFNAGGELGRYRNNPSENFDDSWVDVKGRYDVNKNTNYFGGVNHTRDHEERGTPEVVGTEPTTFGSDQAYAGLAHRMGDYNIRIGGTYEKLDYDNTATVINDDRDREVSGLGVRLNYLYAPNRELFAQGIYDSRNYVLALDESGYNRDSQGYRASVGIKNRYSNRLGVESSVGILHHDFQDPRFADIDIPEASAKINYLSTPQSRIGLSLNRSLEETILPGASSYLSDTLSLQAERRFDSRKSVVATFTAGIADYQDVALKERSVDASLDWRYRINPELYFGVRYRVLVNDSNQATAVGNAANPQYGQDYARQQIMFTLNSMLFDVKDKGFGTPSRLEALMPSETNWHGAYLGAQLSNGSTNAHTFGLRGSADTDDADFAHDGSGAGVFGGIGTFRDRWYFGLEGELDPTKRTLYHSKNKPIARTFNFTEINNVGVSIRGGYKLPTGPLLYTRLGAVRGNFDVNFQVNNEPSNAVNTQTSLDGIRYGIGTDIPIRDNMFLRMDYSYTDYNSYIADAVTTAERFSPSNNVFHLGLGWNLGGDTFKPSRDSKIDINGFYAGALLGNGSLNSHAYGIHNDSGSYPGTYDFTGDFGSNNGATGTLFAGIGREWDRVYLGVEAGVEGSTAHWFHNRDSQGRDFGVEKKSAMSLGVRGGYQLHDGTLVYLSASAVRARFVTTWEKGSNTANYINRDDKPIGVRFGLGAEIPISRSVFLRTGYSVTDYPSYGFTTSHASPDSMTFDNTESLFSFGLGVRF